jgi:F-type H+-transporting ATPase subunit b|tara:strand:+ start:549 stop:962 length:414 start_codon:yes stop_codon:yes gene_type:complete
LYIVLSKIALPRISDVIEERNDTITDDLDEAKALSLEAEKVVDELKSKLEDARSSSQKKLMDERQKSLDIVSSERKKFEENITKEISSSEEKINKGKVEALKEASDLAIDIAEEIINNLYVKKVDKKDLNKFSKDLN